MHIRNVTLADLPAIRDIDRRSFDADDQYSDVQYSQAMTSASSDALAAIDERDNVIAWALIDHASVPVRIRSLAVHPDFRRLGAGAMIVSEAVERFGTPIDLLVDPANTGAIVFYEKLGFILEGVDPQVPQRLRMLRV